jgi:hypothetical protein
VVTVTGGRVCPIQADKTRFLGNLSAISVHAAPLGLSDAKPDCPDDLSQ